MRLPLRRPAQTIAVLCLLLLACAGAAPAHGQGEPAPSAPDSSNAPDGPIHTLRVFANLVQVPTLVLDWRGRPVEERRTGRVCVSLDGGPRFPATHVRVQGEDPIALTVLIDASGSQQELLPKLAAALGALAPDGLKPRDHVSVYAIDCTTKRSITDQPASPYVLGRAVDVALQGSGLHGTGVHADRQKPSCGSSLQLWDTMVYAAAQLSQFPGRRVLLALTDGEDRASKHPRRDVLETARLAGVTVFAVQAIGLPQIGSESALDILCESSGGKVMRTTPAKLESTLQQVIAMLRGRLIVQFPRSNDATPGRHQIDVTTERGRFFIRPAAVTVPLANPEDLADPDVMPNDSSRSPTVGKRRVLAPQ